MSDKPPAPLSKNEVLKQRIPTLAGNIAATLADPAVEKFSEGAEQAIERTRREIEQMRREAASQIIVPDRMPGGLGGPGMGGPGGMPGGGLIRPR